MEKSEQAIDELEKKLKGQSELQRETTTLNEYKNLKLKHDKMVETLQFVTEHMGSRPRDGMEIMKMMMEIETQGHDKVMESYGRIRDKMDVSTDKQKAISKDKMR